MLGTERRRTPTHGETPTTQQALLLHHWAAGSSLAVSEEGREGRESDDKTQGWKVEGVGGNSPIRPTQLVSQANKPTRTNRHTRRQTAQTQTKWSTLLPSTLPSADCSLSPSPRVSLKAAACEYLITNRLSPSYFLSPLDG